MIALKVLMSIISISLIGTSKKVLPLSPYLEEMSLMVEVAGTLLTGHIGLLMLLNTLPNLSLETIQLPKLMIN